MSSFCAASMIVLPLSAWTFRPSISTFTGGRGSDIVRDQALLVVDVILELVAEMLDEALHRQRRGVAQRTDRAAGDVVGDVHEHVEVLASTLSMLDAVDHAPQPACPFSARRALAAGLGEVEVRQPQERTHHAA